MVRASSVFPQDKPGVYYLKGAYEHVIRHCRSYNSRGATLPLTNQQRELYQQQTSYMGTAGLRGKPPVLPYPKHFAVVQPRRMEHRSGWGRSLECLLIPYLYYPTMAMFTC